MRPVIIEAPSCLGLRPTGVETMPEALRAASLPERLGAPVVARVPAPPYEPGRDPATGILNAPGLAAYAQALSQEVGRALGASAFPLVIGGDCSVLLGPMLALARREPRPGLLFLDGHSDFYRPEREPNGEAASMGLALVTGRGPALALGPDGRARLVRDEDAAALGMRDAWADPDYAADPLPPALLALDLKRVHALGAGAAADQAVGHLTRRDREGNGFWIHLDADVLDDAVMPFVDYRMAGGLTLDELGLVLGSALASGRALGLTLTIYNPGLDGDGAGARLLVDLLAAALSSGHDGA